MNRTRADAVELVVRAFCARPGRRSVVVWEPDAPTGTRVAVGATAPYPPLSLAKLVIADAVVHGLPLARGVEDATLGETALRSVVAALRPRAWTVGDLLVLSLTTSDNVAADRLWRMLGRDGVADACRRLELADTDIDAGFGDADLDGPILDGRTTANDVTATLEHLWHAREGDDGHRAIWAALLNSQRNARLPGLLPHELPIAHKTGTMDPFAFDAGIVAAPRPCGLTVLTEVDGDRYELDREISGLARSVVEAMTEALTATDERTGVSGRSR